MHSIGKLILGFCLVLGNLSIAGATIRCAQERRAADSALSSEKEATRQHKEAERALADAKATLEARQKELDDAYLLWLTCIGSKTSCEAESQAESKARDRYEAAREALKERKTEEQETSEKLKNAADEAKSAKKLYELNCPPLNPPPKPPGRRSRV
jgi:hypothetical protein